MREIKFRGRNYDGIWMYGYLIPTPKPQIHLDNKHCVCACPQVMSKVDLVHYEVEENTIGQYTGLKDKNGKEIYEGDIVREKLKRSRKDGDILQICFDDYEWCGKNNVGASTSFYLLSTYHELEVIGNIHDNPELIKEEEK